MPPFYHRVRGQRDDLRPIFLPTAAGGTAVAVPDASWYVAKRFRLPRTAYGVATEVGVGSRQV